MLNKSWDTDNSCVT